MLCLFLLSAAVLASAKSFYTQLEIDGGEYWNKLTKNTSNAYFDNRVYWQYYEVETDLFSSHINVDITWNTADWVANGHSTDDAFMALYITKEGFPAPLMHWDWTDKTMYQADVATLHASPNNLPPGSKVVIGVAGQHGYLYSIEVTSTKGVYVPPVNIEMNKEYTICDWKQEEHGENDIHYCDLVPTQYQSYVAKTEDSCQHKEDCCYAVVFKGEFKLEDQFRAFVNPSNIVASRAHHEYIFAPIMAWHDGWMDPDHRDSHKEKHIKMSSDEIIKVDGDGVYLPPEETGGVHAISVTVTVGPLFYVTSTEKKDGKTIKMKIIELEGEACYPSESYTKEG